ncbi:hypothetical protein DEU56DRAFT_35792 [Suillus clintonianus]|uniref:uncharacterized protein n=1 Tax=Suillus clintonianus TaxID=1904413 RepID=UPI001B8600ED|nr:uncharacterized protein DEU56DRAFT_35792 [Suillus clintonianus]KAG2150570.1 hypothetical protein DEU56DRAFT_35792 [Suillus clintonianus]
MSVEVIQDPLHLRHVLQASIRAFDSDDESFEEGIEMLRAVLPDAMIVAALDIIDREGVMKYKTSWGRHHYEVLGTTSTYTVFPHLDAGSAAVSSYCTCPSFAYAVLISENHLMCKHVLAVCLADRLSRCVVRPIEDDDLLLKITGHVSP